MTIPKTINRPVKLNTEEQFYDSIPLDYNQKINKKDAHILQQAAQAKHRQITAKKALSINLPFSEWEKFKHLSESEGLKFQTKLKQVVYLLNKGYQLTPKS